MSSPPIFSLWIVSKAGGLIYQRSFTTDLPPQSANDLLIAAGTFHGIDAIASRISPALGSSGVQTVESETFKLTCLCTPTGVSARVRYQWPSLLKRNLGVKFILLTAPSHPSADSVLIRAYQAYAAYLQNPFYTADMPLRGAFEDKISFAVKG